VGTGFVTKRAHIDSIGGFPESCMCEDFYTSYLLKAKGLRTLWLNEALAWGLNPETLAEYVGQRSRWGQGTLQTLFLPGGPLRTRGISFLDRLFYLEGATFWNNVLGVPLLMLSPVLFLFCGIPFLPCDADTFFGLFLARIAVATLVTWWLCEGRMMPIIHPVTRLITMVVVVPSVASAMVAPFKRAFRVTLKGQARDKLVVQWKLIWPFLLLVPLTLGGLFMNLVSSRRQIEIGGSTLAMLFLTLGNLVVFAFCALACVELPSPRGVLDSEVPPTQGSFVQSVGAMWTRLVGR
jgi:cellulose synthase (UDP-forming)